MRYRFHTCDVFTGTRFGGNPLAVLPDAQGLTTTQMQEIAREFNFSESAFVLPAEAGHTRRVRIFTPMCEVPFAGHPNIGTAFVLAATGELGDLISITFEEAGGLVPISIDRAPDGRIRCELEAPQRLALGRAFPVALVAAAGGLAPEDLVTTAHEPRVASVGLPFLMTELRSREALERARVDLRCLDTLIAEGLDPAYLHFYVKASDGFDVRARMFSPLDGPPEDPATGSANCALAALLTHCGAAKTGAFRWRIAQGVEMGRPSVLEARTEKKDGVVERVWIGGECVMVSEGTIEVG